MWLYQDEVFDPEKYPGVVGFIYLIENLDTGKKYIGRKLLTKSVRYQQNKKKKTKRIASDWQTYTGSNDVLNEQVQQGAAIVKTILHLCYSKGWMTYLETKEIFARDALIDPLYYNEWVSCKVRSVHLKRENNAK